MSTFERIKKIILGQLDVKESDISINADFIEDLGADSLDIAELIMAFEDEFNIEINDDDIEKIRTVSDVVNYFDEAK
ncbi:MAG: acyl carrier protein [Eubacteriales bacterium]